MDNLTIFICGLLFTAVLLIIIFISKGGLKNVFISQEKADEEIDKLINTEIKGGG